MTRLAIAAVTVTLLATHGMTQPSPRGKLVDLGGHRLHIDCSGSGSPAVIVENGFDEFSFDWTMVQAKVEKFARICTYDRHLRADQSRVARRFVEAR
jgi:hypothetical protein